jgi:predicted enzyme related to lactoylglutathione lyase
MAGEIVHLEMPSSDFARSSAFYEKLFGWRTDGVQSGGHLRFDLPGGVQGSWIRKALAQAPGPVPFVAVADVDKALAEAEKNGGRVLVRRLMLGDRGRFGLLADCDGNVIGVLSPTGASGGAAATTPEAKPAGKTESKPEGKTESKTAAVSKPTAKSPAPKSAPKDAPKSATKDAKPRKR